MAMETQELTRKTRQERYEEAALFYELRAPRFRTPRISAKAAKRLQEALNNAPPLALNEQHEAVTVLQRALIELGDWRISIPDGATGYYGQQTEAAVVAFQKAYKLARHDGKAGNETLGRLDKLYTAPDPPLHDDVLFCPGAINIPRMKQPLTSSCWITTVSMMYFWKFGEGDAAGLIADGRIRYVIDRARQGKQKWLDTYSSNAGLPSADNVPLFQGAYGMQLVSSRADADYFHTTRFWTSHLQRGPLAVNTLRTVFGKGIENHFVIVIGIKPIASGGPVLYLIDPWTGQDYERSLSYMAQMMGWVEDAEHGNQFRDRVFAW